MKQRDRTIAVFLISCIGALAILAAIFLTSPEYTSRSSVPDQTHRDWSGVQSRGPASYIKYAGAVKEGTGGFVVALRLANEQGEYTADDGRLEVWLTQWRVDWTPLSTKKWSVTLFHQIFEVSSPEFQIDEHGDTFWLSKRITFDRLTEQPWNLEGQVMSQQESAGGKTRALFTKRSGESFEGESNDVPWQ